MRADILHESKSVHIKLNKETHLLLRTLAFKHGISIQDLFGECANHIANGSKIGTTIVENVVSKKLRAILEGTAIKRKKLEGFSELDSESLYSLINSEKEM